MIEQATQTTETSAAPTSEYAALKAAVEAAQAEQPDLGRAEDPPKPPTPKSKDVASAEAKEAIPAETDATEDAELPRIAKLLKAREKARETELESRKQASSILEQAKAEAAKFLEEARKTAQAEFDKQRADYADKLRKNPYKFIEEHGLDRETLINEVAREGTPEYQLIKRAEERAAAAEKKLAEHDKRWEAWEKREQERELAGQTQKIREVEKQFLGLVTLDSAPNLRKLYEDSEIVEKGHRLARRLRDETGENASLEELRDYLEHEAKTRLAKLSAPATPAKDATKKPANGTRTLSGTAQSERRAMPKDFKAAKTPEEEQALLMAAAEEAMKG